MRILWIKSELLHPVDKGGRIRTYQMLRALSRRHHVTYLALDDGLAAPDAIQLAKEYSTEVVVVPFRPPPKATVGYFLALILNLFSNMPYSTQRYCSSRLGQEISRLASEADLLVCDFLAPAANVPVGLTIPTVLFQHNVEAMIWQRHADNARNPLMRLYMKHQWRKMLNFEREQCLRFSHVVAVSESDAGVLRREYGVQSPSHVATGVDLEYFGAHAEVSASGHDIVFVGSMDWMPNEDGIRWFVDQVLPKVRLEVPSAKLFVVGRSPSEAIRDLGRRDIGVKVTGTVADVRPYVRSAALFVVPLRIGGGTRLKIFEAMAMGTPVVSTTIGAEGLPIIDGEHLVIADTPRALADEIIRLLRDRGAARALADSAAQYVRLNCSWDAVAEQFIQQCLPVTAVQRHRNGTEFSSSKA